MPIPTKSHISLHGNRFQLSRKAPSRLFLDGIEAVPAVVEGLITSAQMLALNATPVTLVAAPGAGRALILERMQLWLDYNSAAYAGIAAGEDISIKYTDGSGAAVAGVEATGFLDATADAFRWVKGYNAASSVSDFTPTANAALVIQMLTGEITTGNSPLRYRLWYRNVELAWPI
jgi:hypothetical protein